MNRTGKLVRPVILGAGTLAGLAGAHAVNYWLLISDPLRRQEVLHATGHAWLPQVESLAIACALASVVGALAFGWRRRTPDRSPIAGTAARLALAQSLGFVALEFGERAFAGAPLHHLSPLLLAAGLGLQVLIAGGISLAFSCLSRAGARLAQAFSRRPASQRSATRSPMRAAKARALRTLHSTDCDPIRGPPALAS